MGKEEKHGFVVPGSVYGQTTSDEQLANTRKNITGWIGRTIGLGVDGLRTPPDLVLSLGHGDGDELPHIRDRFSDARIIGIDIKPAGENTNKIARAASVELMQVDYRDTAKISGLLSKSDSAVVIARNPQIHDTPMRGGGFRIQNHDLAEALSVIGKTVSEKNDSRMLITLPFPEDAEVVEAEMKERGVAVGRVRTSKPPKDLRIEREGKRFVFDGTGLVVSGENMGGKRKRKRKRR